MVSWAGASDLDRVDHQRTSPTWVADRWRAADARVLELTAQGRFPTVAAGTRLRLTDPAGPHDPDRHRLLGLVAGAPVFSVAGEPDGELRDLREVGGTLGDTDRDVAAAAAAVEAWHRLEPCCPRCGTATRAVNGGFARHCDACDRDHFPRTDPAVIVAVVDADDRLLLASQASWGPRVSVLAGFVEAGESLEQAIHREIAEESGVRLGETCYFGSQPWPFPRSLMVGYFARAVGTDLDIDADELVSADWYTRERLGALLAAGTLGLPGTSSIASRMIAAWRQGRGPL